MTTMRTEMVPMSALLCDPPPVITGPAADALVRSLGLTKDAENFAASVVAGHVETLDAWAERVLGGA